MKTVIVLAHFCAIGLLGLFFNNPQPVDFSFKGVASVQDQFELPNAFKVGADSFGIDPNRDTLLYIGNQGTKVFIPKHSFLYLDGRVVNHLVTITFKEFKNSADMAFSNLPMNYTELGKDYNFSSSGMFEMYGFQGQNEVKIDRSKPLKMDYHLAYQNPEISFFRMREDSSGWVKIQHIEKLKKPQVQLEEGFAADIQLAAKGDLRNDWEGSEVEMFEEEEPKKKKKRKNRGRGELAGAIDGNDGAGDVGGGVLDGVVLDGEWDGEGWEEGNWDDGDWVQQDDGDRNDGTLLAEGINAGHTYPDIVKGLNVDGFGVYNCDQMYRLPNRVQLAANYVDETGTLIRDLEVVSMIDLNYNGAFSFNPSEITCDAKGDNVLLLFTKSEELYLLDKGEFGKMGIDSSGDYTFKMKNVTAKIKSTEDLRTHLGIKI